MKITRTSSKEETQYITLRPEDSDPDCFILQVPVGYTVAVKGNNIIVRNKE